MKFVKKVRGVGEPSELRELTQNFSTRLIVRTGSTNEIHLEYPVFEFTQVLLNGKLCIQWQIIRSYPMNYLQSNKLKTNNYIHIQNGQKKHKKMRLGYLLFSLEQRVLL